MAESAQPSEWLKTITLARFWREFSSIRSLRKFGLETSEK